MLYQLSYASSGKPRHNNKKEFRLQEKLPAHTATLEELQAPL